MSENEEYQRLARKFIDSWQEQTASMMNDGQFIRTLLQMMQTAPFSATDGTPYANPFTAKPAGRAAAAPDARDATLARIERSLGVIEERLERLEHDAGRAKPRVAAKPKARGRVAGAAKKSAPRSGGRARSKKKRR